MQRVLAAGLGVLALTTLLLGAYSWTLTSRVTALEGQVAALAKSGGTTRDPRAAKADRVALQNTVTALREASAKGEPLTEEQTTELVESVVQDAVDEAIDRRSEQRELEQKDKQTALMAESIRVEVEDVGKEFDVDDAKVDEAIEILVGMMYEGQALGEELQAGTIGMREAKEEGERLKDELEAELTRVLGEPAYEELGRKFYGERGWDAGG